MEMHIISEDVLMENLWFVSDISQNSVLSPQCGGVRVGLGSHFMKTKLS